MKNNTNITYRRVGDFNIPNLRLLPEEANITLSKWGMLHKYFLHKHKQVLFTTLLAEGNLWQDLADIDTQAQQMFDALIEQLKKAEVITGQLKEDNQMEWVCRTQNIEARAKEFDNDELLFN